MAERAETAKMKLTDVRNVVVLSVVFLLVFCAYDSIECIQSSLNEADGLGVISVACIYVAFMISCLYSPLCIAMMGCKKTIIISISIHTLYTVSNFYPLWPTLIGASLLLGLVSGPIWTAQATYVTQRAVNYAKSRSKIIQNTVSKFQAIFFGVVLSSYVVGNIISSLVLRSDVSTVSNVTSGKANCGLSDCLISASNVTTTTVTRPPDDVIYILLAVLTSLDLIALLIVVVFLQDLPVTPASESIKKTFLLCAKINVNNPKMPLLLPLFISQTFTFSILLADYTKSYVSCALGIGMVGYVMTASGVMSVTSSFVFGRLAKHTGRVPQIIFMNLTHVGLLVGIYLWTPTDDDFYVFFVVAALWGMGEPIFNTQCTVLLTAMFPDQQDAAFANYHFWRGLGFASAFAFSHFMCVSTKLILGIVFQVSGMLLYACVELMVCRQRTRANKGDITDVDIEIEFAHPLTSTQSNSDIQNIT